MIMVKSDDCGQGAVRMSTVGFEIGEAEESCGR